ncbi:MAG: DUF3783 domain-containing protein [Thermoplasmatota archaeon]
MDPLGVMLYGFDRSSGESIVDYLSKTCGREVLLISGSGREEDKVMDILSDEEYREFEEKEDPKVVMFLGFDGPLIHASMDGFPALDGQQRPIFCTPTQENVNWKLSELLADLKGEREYFRRKEQKR